MRAETWQAVNAYRFKFGKDFCDLRGIKNSEESDLIARITEEMKKPVPKKKKAVEVEDDG